MKSKYISIAIISCLMLMLELTFTRILSFIYWNHLVYLIISVVLLGYGVGSMFVIIFRSWLDRFDFRIVQGYLLLGFSISIPTSMAIMSRVILYTQNKQLGLLGPALPILMNYLCFIVPFLFLGAAIVYYFVNWPAKSGSLYLFDLAGAAAGCVLFPLLLTKLGAPHLAMLIAIAGCALSFAMMFGNSSGKRISGSVMNFIVVIVIVLVWVFQGKIMPIRPVSGKILSRAYAPGATIEYTRWDPGARVDIAHAQRSSAITGRDFPIPDLPLKVLTNDGDAYTVIIDKNAYSLNAPCENTFRFLQSTPYLLYQPKNVLIIGTGGGPDIIKALACKSGQITGVEVAGSTIKAMEGPYADYSGGIYIKPNVKVYHDEGRSFIRRSNEKYNIIQMSGVDTFSALSTGAYVLAENYLYTVDALKDYIDHLDDNGFLIIRRWFFADKPRESLRLFVLAFHALKEKGISDPGQHIVVAGRLIYANTIVKKIPLTNEEIETFEKENDRVPELGTVFSPKNNYCDNENKNYFYEYACAFVSGREQQFIDNYFYDISPVYDNNPFFFKYYKLGNMASLGDLGSSGRSIYWAHIILILVLAQSLAIVAIFIFGPLLLFRREGLSLRGAPLLLIYFACLGVGFIMIEIVLMQQIALFLGLPVYSIAVVLSGLLFSAGLGSMVSEKVTISRRKLLVIVTIVLMFVICAANFGLQAMIHHFLGAPFAARVILSLAVVFPIGFLLGFYFPVGIVEVSRAGNIFVPWAWGINSGFTVVGSIVAIIIAMIVGFKNVMWISLLIYLIALASMAAYKSPAD